MAIDLKGAKKIGFMWAVWDYGREEWSSVSANKPPPSQAPSDSVFSIDSAIEMQEKGIGPSKRMTGAEAQPREAVEESPYTPRLPQQGGPAVVRADSSFFSLPSQEQLEAEQRRAPVQERRVAYAAEGAQAAQKQAMPFMNMKRVDVVTPAIAGGIAMGVLMGIPVLNVCVPAWFLGGMLGVFLLLAESPVRSTLAPREAARIGALVGVVGAVVSLLVSFIAIVFVGDAIISMAGGSGSEITMLALNAIGVDGSNDIDLFFAVFTIISRLILFPIFGALGGVLYVKYGRK